MTLALAAVIAAGIVLPHVLRLERVAPVVAIALWLSALALRALACAFVVVYVLLYLPRTGLFDVLTHWCWTALVPFVDHRHEVDGHSVGDLAVQVPLLLLVLSLVWVVVEVLHAHRATRRLIEREVIGHGPRGSLIVGGPEIDLAVAGITRPQILVSAGALALLDDDELAAALDHEQAHIVRGHRFVTLVAAWFRAAGWLVPGARRAVRELAFHLERDADRWALRRRDDRLALASVITKAAESRLLGGDVAVAQLGRSGVRQRVTQLLEDEPARRRPAAAALHGLAATMLAATLMLAAIVPAAAVAGVEHDAHLTHHAHRCNT
jgi:Zn-dependent protease with chaperone function